jgi:hypothetical protein
LRSGLGLAEPGAPASLSELTADSSAIAACSLSMMRCSRCSSRWSLCTWSGLGLALGLGLGLELVLRPMAAAAHYSSTL